MSWWKDVFDNRRNAGEWDAARPEDEAIAEFRALFEAAREEVPAPDEKLWEKLRPQLAAHEAAPPDLLSFVASLATTGPRLAVAALGVFLLAAGMFWSPGAERRTNITNIEVAAWEARNPLNLMVGMENAMQAIGNGLEAQTGQDLLRYVAYDSSER